ncbi:EPIDERMAL PATTERNING FACTOR-like protein 5 [Cardamine amara subsp. amara]|uniref:Epidermal patterning factor-like protein n=1 Tax=Cardamine amara subsp. amara TaxID=228776 RepID=A0ABD0ZSL6_CARAN
MGVVFRRHHRRFIPTLYVIAFLLFLFSSAASLHGFSGGLGQGGNETAGSGLPDRIVDQKRLGGPGSAPPKCRSKCGKCEPCKAVHVPIQPGLIMPLEYYPEAWRCKCGNKIFMP